MNELLKSSFLWRLCAVIAAWLSRTRIVRIGQALGSAVRDSAPFRALARFLKGPVAAERSEYRRRLDRINAALCRWGRRFRTALRESLIGRALRALLAVLSRSALLGRMFRGGVSSALLCVIAAYYPIDRLLRLVPGLELAASLWDEALIVFCFLWIIFRRVNSETPLRSRASAADVSVGIYLLTGLILLLYTLSAPDVNVTGFRASMQYVLIFFIVTRLIGSERDLRMMYRLMVVLAFLFALHGILQFVIGVEIPDTWTDQAELSVRTRVYSVFKNPNILGGYMVLFAPMAIGAAYATDDAAEKVFFWFCGICMCLACLFTMSRGAWLALAAAALLFSLIVDRRLFALLVVCAIGACFLPFVRSRIGYLFTSEFSESNARGGRGKRWATAFGYLDEYDRWATGLGYGMFGGAVSVQNPINPEFNYMYVDNYYVKTLAENGIIGLCGLISMLLGLLWNGVRACARTGGSSRKPLCAGMLTGMLGILIQSFFESLWEEPYMMALFFAVAGMLVYTGFFCKDPAES